MASPRAGDGWWRSMSRERGPAVVIRPATAADQAAITRIVRDANINPWGLGWRRFLVADELGQVVGTGQIKPHGDGSRELASIAVIPRRRGHGVGGSIIRALLAREAGPLHLLCRRGLEAYYARFGFRRLAEREMPPYFRRIAFLARMLAPFSRLFAGDAVHIIVMRRPGEDA